ncbi:MAG: ATP-dependent zinc metalloprotease FtsH [Eubacteriales bacterium]|nr:ATP-dependent zinc metalloprotease FtsH [Eubacteriales bacterium]
MNKKRRASDFSFYIVLIVVIMMSSLFMSRMGGSTQAQLSEVISDIEAGNVDSIVLNGNKLEVELKAVDKKPAERYTKQIHTLLIPEVYKSLNEARKSGQIEKFDYRQPPDFSSIFNMVLIVLMVIGMGFFIWFSFARQGGSDGRNAMNFGRSRAKINHPDKNQVTFNDVAGVDEEKQELSEVVDFLKNPQKYSGLGAKIPRGILLVGAPGTGKTLLAKAVAGEAGVPFFTTSGSEFVEMFVGVGATRIRDLFENAKKHTPCIVFIDEIDAVGRHRGAGLGGGHDEREQTLNQLLVEMDGFGPNEGVIIMAATNRPDILDPALLRPGRFDRQVMVMRPDLNGRFEILKVHARNKPIAENVDLMEIARMTPGFTGADLSNLLNEAALLAARKSAKEIKYEDISEAVFKVTVGPEKKSRVISEKERKLTAYHESGHAIVLRAVSRVERVERVTIIPAGGAGGYTAYKPHEDLYFQTKDDLENTIKFALGGRAAEELIQGEISTGASQDLQEANRIAREMITKYGMSERLGNFVLGESNEPFVGLEYGHQKQISEATAAIVDEEVKKILSDSYSETMQILNDNIDVLHALAQRLLEVEKVEGPEFEAIYKAHAADWKPAPGGEEQVYLSELKERDLEASSEQDSEPKAEAEAETAPLEEASVGEAKLNDEAEQDTASEAQEESK